MITRPTLRSKTVSATPHYDFGAKSREAPDSVSPALIEAMDWLEYGVLLVNAEARVCFVNRRAQNLVHAQELNLIGGQLRGDSLAQTIVLHELIARYARQNSDDARAREVSCHRLGRLMLQFAGVSPGLSHGLGAKRLVAVFVIDPESFSDPTPPQLQRQFGLTPAEAEIACEIVKGEGLVTCARRMGISRATASTHLQRIFEKTGTKRQAQLVRAILALRPAIRATSEPALRFAPCTPIVEAGRQAGKARLSR
jgi:DNA-binding CsgD family transcriptional regulator